MVLILLSIVSVIDLTEKMDKYARANLSTLEILSYYKDYIPWIGTLITPITIFIATVYVCARMAAHTEIIAILSSGVSFKRLLFPYFMGSLIVASASFVLNGWIIPNSNKTRLAFELQYLQNKFYYDKRNVHMQVSPNVYMYMQSYQNVSKTGYHFTMERFEDNRLIEKLSANRIVWDSLKQKWTLHEWKIKKIDTLFHVPDNPSATFQTTAAPKLEKDVASGTNLDTALVIHPKEFESDYRKYDGMTINELSSYISTLRERGSAGVEFYEVEKYTRFASPVTIFILVFMGVIVSARKSRGGTGLQIALGFVLSFVFILFFTLFRTFAENGSMPPQISVWIPNIIFGIIALAMYKYVPR